MTVNAPSVYRLIPIPSVATLVILLFYTLSKWRVSMPFYSGLPDLAKLGMDFASLMEICRENPAPTVYLSTVAAAVLTTCATVMRLCLGSTSKYATKLLLRMRT